MARRNSKTVVCPLCRQKRSAYEMVPGQTVRDAVVQEIHEEQPDWPIESELCQTCLNRFRAEHVRRLLEEEKGELSALDEEVVRSLREQELISENINTEFEHQLTFGERLSDGLAAIGGSWSFIIAFAAVLMVWIVINTLLLTTRPFDPYPFILLNLVLSCLAAIQAPIIMMSQNRQEAKDRLRSEHDYRVNLKAEVEIRLLHMKMDQLLTHQWQRLLEIQQLQVDLMEDVANARHVAGPPKKP